MQDRFTSREKFHELKTPTPLLNWPASYCSSGNLFNWPVLLNIKYFVSQSILFDTVLSRVVYDNTCMQ